MLRTFDPVHSANVPDKAAKTSGNALTAVVSYYTLYLFHAFYTLSQLGDAS